jgi:hypothetical protein
MQNQATNQLTGWDCGFFVIYRGSAKQTYVRLQR